MLGHCDLHELGHVEGEGEGGDWDDVDQEASRVRHRQADRSVLVWAAHSDVSETKKTVLYSRVPKKNQKSEFWYATNPTGFHR